MLGVQLLLTHSQRKIIMFIFYKGSEIINQINKNKINKKYYKNFKLSRKLKSISGNFNASEYHYIFYVLPATAFDNFSDDYLKYQKINELIICSKESVRMVISSQI